MFFIISGFFMCFTFLKKEMTFKTFCVSKIARLWPVLLFSLFSFMIITLFIESVHYYKYENIVSAFFIRSSFAVYIPTNNGAAWYINVVFFGYIFYFCLFGIIPREKRKYAVGIIIFFLYSLLINKQDLYIFPQVFLDGFLTVPMTRALAGMGLGYILGEIYSSEKSSHKEDIKSESIYSVIFFTIVEAVTIIYLFKFSIIKFLDYAFIIMTILFVILFICFLYQKGLISRILDKDKIFKMGKYCFSIYMMQEFCFQILNKYLWTNTTIGVVRYPILNMLAGLIFCITVGVLTYYLVENPCQKIILKNFTNKEKTACTKNQIDT